MDGVTIPRKERDMLKVLKKMHMLFWSFDVRLKKDRTGEWMLLVGDKEIQYLNGYEIIDAELIEKMLPSWTK